MKKVALCLLILVIFISAAQILRAQDSQVNNNGDTRIVLPEIKKFRTKNQLQVFYLKDELPQMTIVLSAGFGRLYENSKNAGLSDLLGSTLLLSGSAKYPGDKLTEKIDELGGKINISSGWETLSISVQVLHKHADQVLELLKDLLQNPRFDGAKLELARSLALENIKREKDDPFMYSYSAMRQILFQSKGYGARKTESSIKNLKISDIKNAWDKYVCSENMVMAVSTSLPFSKISSKIESVSSVIKNGEREDYNAKIDIEKYQQNAEKIFFIKRKIPQATIVMGAPAPVIKNHERYALAVMNEILGGGGFNSRLMKEIRVKRGLAYSTGSIIRSRKNTGVFIIYAQVGIESTYQTLEIINHMLQDIKNNGVKSSEIKQAVASLSNSFIFQFDTPMSILSKYSSLWYNGLADRYLVNFPKKISKINNKHIKAASINILKKGLVTVIIGDENLLKQLKSKYDVKVLE